MPKIIKKRSLKGQTDETLMETVDDIKSRIKTQQKALVITLAVVIAVLLIAGGIYYYLKSNSDKADGFRRAAYVAFYNEGAAQPAVAGENFKKALDLFRQSYDVRKNADTLLHIAYCQYFLGNYDEAIATLKEFNTTFNDPAIAPLAQYKLAEAYLKKGDRENALAALNSIIASKGIYQDMALKQIAGIYELQGKREEARAKYKELADKFPNSALAAEAKAKAER
jgi:TolA-binding protein